VSLPPDPASVLTEIDLLARIGTGDREALRELYALHGAALFSLALRMTGSPADAEEVVQDTFVKIWRHAADYDARLSRPFTWAVTILRRTCIDRLRQQHRAPVATPLPLLADASPALATPEQTRATVDARDAAQRLRAALAQISSPQRDALELALFSPLTHAEIAAHLAQPTGSVKSWIRRGLLQLRTALADSEPVQ
jgi:RNA polymerase sigma-70 factor (ECF subfamily)